MSRLFQVIVFIAVASLLAGCKLAVIVGEGGKVLSQSGSRDCSDTSYCINEITDTNFNETFTAVPKEGYEFVKWQGGWGFRCGDSTNPTCTVLLSGHAFAAAITASYEVGYIMPVFKDVGVDTDGDGDVNRVDEDDDNDGILDAYDPCPLDSDTGCIAGAPITDTVTISGKEWAQVDLFLNLSWEEINAVCPMGRCAKFGTLNGYDMSGWMWASVDDVNALFNYYAGGPILGPGPGITLSGTSIALAFFSDGWRPLVDNDYQKVTGGFMSDTAEHIGIIGFTEQAPHSTALATEAGLVIVPGGWFYRNP